MQKQWQELLLITSYNGAYQEEYKIPIHFYDMPLLKFHPTLVRDVIMQVGHCRSHNLISPYYFKFNLVHRTISHWEVHTAWAGHETRLYWFQVQKMELLGF